VKPWKASRSFLKKRTKKLLFYKFLALRRRARQVTKSFCFFFQKEMLSSVVSVNDNAGWYNSLFWRATLADQTKQSDRLLL